MPLVHHELCFGCGRTNLFGLLLEVEPAGPGAVKGRCFIKQDHQGARRATAHDGILAAALTEAMAFACGPGATAHTLEVTLLEPVAVGAFVDVEAQAHEGEEGRQGAIATASADGVHVALARGTFSS